MAKARKHHKKLHQPVSWNIAIPILIIMAIVAGYLLKMGMEQSGQVEDSVQGGGVYRGY